MCVVCSRGRLTVIVWDGGGSYGRTEDQEGDSLTLPTLWAPHRSCGGSSEKKASSPLPFFSRSKSTPIKNFFIVAVEAI